MQGSQVAILCNKSRVQNALISRSQPSPLIEYFQLNWLIKQFGLSAKVILPDEGLFPESSVFSLPSSQNHAILKPKEQSRRCARWESAQPRLHVTAWYFLYECMPPFSIHEHYLCVRILYSIIPTLSFGLKKYDIAPLVVNKNLQPPKMPETSLIKKIDSRVNQW